jgi:hypothetical protein
LRIFVGKKKSGIAYVTCVCTYDAHKCGQIVNITHRRFEQVLCNLGRVGKTERLIIYFNKLVKPPQILQPVALLMFRVEVIQMLLPSAPIQICQAKLVLLT